MGINDEPERISVLVPKRYTDLCDKILTYLVDTKVITKYKKVSDIDEYFKQEVSIMLMDKDDVSPKRLSHKIISYLISTNVITGIWALGYIQGNIMREIERMIKS